MIVNEHISDYIASLDADITPELMALERWALEQGVPIIRHDMQVFLRFLLRKEKPKAILEIGAAVGFSTLFMHEYMPEDAAITTIEKVEMRLVHTRKNLEGHERIRLIEDDATNALAALLEQYNAGQNDGFDFIFLDAAKGQYPAWLPTLETLLRPDGLLITDNVLLEGTIGESKFAIERRDRTIHMRMREYLYELTHNDRLDTVILPIGDGAAVSYKRR